MLDIKDVIRQLDNIGYKVTAWQKGEIKELCNALSSDEVIVNTINGHYEGGFGILVATNHRLLLVDRKIMFLTLDSISYGMIQEISLTYRLLNSTLHIFTSNKSLDFSSLNHSGVRKILDFTQKSIIAVRRHQYYSPLPDTIQLSQPEAQESVPLPRLVPEINYKGQLTPGLYPGIEEQLKPSPNSSSLKMNTNDLANTKHTYSINPMANKRVYARKYY